MLLSEHFWDLSGSISLGKNDASLIDGNEGKGTFPAASPKVFITGGGAEPSGTGRIGWEPEDGSQMAWMDEVI